MENDEGTHTEDEEEPLEESSCKRSIRPTFGVVIIGCVLALLVYVGENFGGWPIAGASFATWVILLTFSALCYIPAVILTYIILGFIRVFFPTLQITNRLVSMRKAVTFTCWSFMEFAVISVVFNRTPFDDTRRESIDDAKDIADRFGVVVAFGSILSLLKRYLLERYVKSTRRIEYATEKGREAQVFEEGLRRLCVWLNPLVFKRANVDKLTYNDVLVPEGKAKRPGLLRFWRDRNPTNTKNSVAATATPSQRTSESGSDSGSEDKSTAVDARPTSTYEEIDNETLEYLVGNYISCCNKQIILRSKNDARKLGKLLFKLYAREKSFSVDSETVTRSNSKMLVEVKELTSYFSKDNNVLELINSLLGASKTGYITKSDMVNGVMEIYQRRKQLGRSVEQLASTVKAVENFCSVFIVIASCCLLLIIFSTGEFADVVLTASTSIFALSFIFADTAKNLFNSFMLVFVRHPYDIGDRVKLDSIREPLNVSEITLLNTTFRQWTGLITTIPNHQLYQMTIHNYARSGPMIDEFTISIASATPSKTIRALEDRFLSFCRKNPDLYERPDCEMFAREYHHSNSLLIIFYIGNSTNWQYGQQLARRHKVLLAVKDACEELGITYSHPHQPVTVRTQDNRPLSPTPAYEV
eukprot:m.92904 g.92904  ORF g.92904 m.92904 type:complete len:643 (-) comp13370_c0_seq2:756-2684(-)